MRDGDEFAIALHADDGQLVVGIRPDGSIAQGPDYQPDEAAREFWEAITRAAHSAAPWAEEPARITGAMVRAAAEAIEDEKHDYSDKIINKEEFAEKKAEDMIGYGADGANNRLGGEFNRKARRNADKAHRRSMEALKKMEKEADF